MITIGFLQVGEVKHYQDIFLLDRSEKLPGERIGWLQQRAVMEAVISQPAIIALGDVESSSGVIALYHGCGYLGDDGHASCYDPLQQLAEEAEEPLIGEDGLKSLGEGSQLGKEEGVKGIINRVRLKSLLGILGAHQTTSFSFHFSLP
jgi:hypothetical protein